MIDLHSTPEKCALDIDRTPPNSIEAEQGVLGCILLDPKNALAETIAKTTHEAFYDLRHQTLYQVLVELDKTGKPIDLITLSQTLKDSGQLEGVGGMGYLASLADTVPSASNLSYYLEILIEKWNLRRMLAIVTDAAARIFENPEPGILGQIEKEVLAVRSRGTQEGLTAKGLVHEALEHIENLHERAGRIGGISTGLLDLDKMHDGLHPGEFIVLAGPPSMGKTALAMGIAVAVALQSIPVGVFSLEMTARSVMTRMICAESRVNLRDIRDGRMTERDFPRITVSAVKIAQAPLHFDDCAGLTATQFRGKGRRMINQHGVKFMVVDYLQLMSAADSVRKGGSKVDEIEEISKTFKQCARDWNIPIIVLSALTNEELRGSRQIQYDADSIWKLRKTKAEEAADNNDAMAVDLEIAKQRNGPTGIINLMFLKNFTRFEMVSRVNVEDYPG